MPTSTYTPIASQTLTSSASSVTFSSIPTDGTYRDLVLVINAKPVRAGEAFMQTTFNGVSSDYSIVFARGSSGGAGSGSYSDTTMYTAVDAFNSTNGGVSIMQIMDYSQTNKHKTLLS